LPLPFQIAWALRFMTCSSVRCLHVPSIWAFSATTTSDRQEADSAEREKPGSERPGSTRKQLPVSRPIER
jgi:hypothetical protein